MIPIVNDRHKYILLYSAKAGCTSVRKLFLEIHREELSSDQQKRLNWYHNLNELLPFDVSKSYEDYKKILITRNPYSRIVSAFLDQYVYARSSAVEAMFDAVLGPGQTWPTNFLEFLRVLEKVPDQLRDSHFQTQSYFAFAPAISVRSKFAFGWFERDIGSSFLIDDYGDIANLNKLMLRFYKKLYRADKKGFERISRIIPELKKSNSSFYGKEKLENAWLATTGDLDARVFAPAPQDFLEPSEVRDLIESIYEPDFSNFGYKVGDIPQKSASSEINLIPKDFDWRMYLRLNPDLTPDIVYNERGVVRHYLEFGRFEEHPRAYKIEAPEGFCWQRYLKLNPDLLQLGVDDEMSAIEHYISYGIRQLRRIN